MPKTKRSRQAHKLPSHWGVGPDVEDLDPMPLEIPAMGKIPETFESLVSRLVVENLAREKLIDDKEIETFEEADDFEEEDPDTLDFTAYELSELQEHQEHNPWFNPERAPVAEQEAAQATIEIKDDPTPQSDQIASPEASGEP